MIEFWDGLEKNSPLEQKADRITAPTSNWRFSGLLKICAGIKFSDIFEK